MMKKSASWDKSGFVNAEDVDFSDGHAVLKAALQNEVRGRELYAQYARAVSSPVAKRVFVYLANAELNHIEDIKLFIKSLKTLNIDGEDDIDIARMVKSGGNLDSQKLFFGKLVSELNEQVHPTDDDNKSREVAMEIEKAGYEYYREAAESATDESLKKFFEWLTEQEQGHYMLIRNAYEYASNPDSWFAGEEHWLLEG